MVRKSVFRAPLLALGFGLLAYGQGTQVPTKVGIIDFRGALVTTKDGQKAVEELKTKIEPKRRELEKKQAEIAGLRDQVQKGSNTMNDEQKNRLIRDIDAKTRALNRETEDAQAEMDQEQQRILQELAGKMSSIINKYATDNGYAVILDIGTQQTPVLYAASGVDITQEIVALYDKAGPAPAAAPATTGAAKPAAPATTPAPAPAAKKPAAAK